VDVWCERDKLFYIELRQRLGMEDIGKWSREIDGDGMDMF